MTMAAEAVTRIERKAFSCQIGDCIVTLLPQFGGKVASDPGQGPRTPASAALTYAPRTRTMGFNEGDASGWDECMPCVSGCTVQTVNGQQAFPITATSGASRGRCFSADNGSVTLSADGFSLPLTLVRTTKLTRPKKGTASRLTINSPIPATRRCLGPGRRIPAMRLKRGDILSLPESIKALRIEWTRNDRLDKSTGTAAWPLAKLAAGGETDLRISADASQAWATSSSPVLWLPQRTGCADAAQGRRSSTRQLRCRRNALSRPVDLPRWLSGRRCGHQTALRRHGTNDGPRGFTRHHRPLVAHPGRRRIVLLADDCRS